MPTEYWPLLVKPTQPSTSLPGVLPFVDQDYNYENGFAPVDTATIVPYALSNRFVWKEKYKRPIIEVYTSQKPLKPISALKFDVILYQGTSPGFENSTQRYVFIGENDQVSVGFWNTFMLYQDLVDRLGQYHLKYYAEDSKRLSNGQMPFPVWDQSGRAPSFAQKKISFETFLSSASKGWNDRDDQMFAFMCCWASAAMFPPTESFSTVMRFFDEPMSNVQLYFRIQPTLRATGVFDWFRGHINTVRDQAISRGGFVPTGDYEITTFLDDPPGGAFEANKTLLGRHPVGLYEVWASVMAKSTLLTAGVLLSKFEFSNDHTIMLRDNQVKIEYPFPGITNARGTLLFPPATPYYVTQTEVTPLKINAARNKDRDPDQNTVMLGNGAPYTAQKLWAGVPANTKADIEWLHRSAFSYGGLGSSRGPKSSQTVNNLVLGTGATNTAMLRVEQFIKRYSQKEGAKVNVSTRTLWHHPVTAPGMHEPQNEWGWMAPWIEYTFSSELADIDMTKPLPKVIEPTTIYFETQARLKPLRFDFELGRHIEAAWFGWEDTSVKDDFVDKSAAS